MSVLGVVGPFFHITGLMVRTWTTLLLFVVTLAGYFVMLSVVVTQALDGAELDTLYWLVPGAAKSSACVMMVV